MWPGPRLLLARYQCFNVIFQLISGAVLATNQALTFYNHLMYLCLRCTECQIADKNCAPVHLRPVGILLIDGHDLGMTCLPLDLSVSNSPGVGPLVRRLFHTQCCFSCLGLFTAHILLNYEPTSHGPLFKFSPFVLAAAAFDSDSWHLERLATHLYVGTSFS
jgi:hypothetical protein